MAEYFISFTENINGAYGYLVLCVCAFVENVIPPIPGDTVIIFGGYLAGIGRLSMFGTVLSTTAGSFAGFMVMFCLGRFLGEKFFIDRDIYIFPRDNFLKVSKWFEKFGYAVIFCNRFLSGARSVISIFAGVTGLNITKVALYSFVSCFVWNLLLVYAGCSVGENWGLVTDLLQKYNIIVLTGLLALAVIFVTIKIFKSNSGHL
jgi:membrane protein DedA with SNARE-associated domain